MADQNEKAKKAMAILAVLKKLYPVAKTELNYDKKKPYELLFSVIMSAQCTDKMVNKVTENLYKKYTKLTDFTNATLEEFQNDIKSIGLYKGKAKNILATAKILVEQYNEKIPKTMAELIELPGVARKTANVVLGELYGINEGVTVDTHIRRLSNAFGLTTNDDPKKIEKDLMAILPQEEWHNFSSRLVLYGRYYWTAKQKTHDGPLATFISY